jgi:CubicO group peptidase (beta-lactamase class C family)
MTRTTRRSVSAALGCLPLSPVLFAGSGPPGTVTPAESRAMPENLKLIGLQVGGIFQAHIASGYMPGAVALISRGERVEIVIVGRQSQEAPDPMRRDSLFRISSMTKPITAVAAVMLIDEGRLHLDAPVEHWLPELKHRRVLRHLDGDLADTVAALRPITVSDLLTFRCGLGVLLVSPDSYPILKEIRAQGLLGFSPPDPSAPLRPDEWLHRLGALPLMMQPGEHWLYNTGSYILGVLLARASGKSLPELLQKRIFEPLGMYNTAFYVPEGARARFVTAYRTEGGRSLAFDNPVSTAWGTPPAFPDAGAGLISCADDYFRFALLLLNRGRHEGRQLVSEALVDRMLTDQLTDAQRQEGLPILGPGRGWGFGVSVVHEQAAQGLPVGAYGWNGGLGTTWIADPKSGLGVIVMTQTVFASPTPPAVHEEVWRAVFSPAVL